MIYDAHQPIGKDFQPPRAGTMPPRRRFVTIGIDANDRARAARTGESPGHLSGLYRANLGEARKRGTKASAEAKKK